MRGTGRLDDSRDALTEQVDEQLEQLTMFGVPPRREVGFNVYHDESGTYSPSGGDRWLLHGVLLVPTNRQAQFFAEMQAVRHHVDYCHQVHYRRLGKSATGPKGRCCAGWLSLYAARFSQWCFYHCLGVDTESPAFSAERFREPHHAYNYFARTAMVGGIAWCLSGHREVALRFHSHCMVRSEADNFETYIPREVIGAIEEKRRQRPGRYPEIRLLADRVLLVDADPKTADSGMREECELTQLTDLMTSGLMEALTAQLQREGKLALADLIAGWVLDTRKPPWLQREELHRRFSVSCFPGPDGGFYNPALRVATRHQMRLFQISD